MSTGERVLSAAVGLGMVVYGPRRRTVPAIPLAPVGGSIPHRGLTGHSRAFSTTILGPREELYHAWRDFEKHPRFIRGMGGYAGSHAEHIRVPFADVGPRKVPDRL